MLTRCKLLRFHTQRYKCMKSVKRSQYSRPFGSICNCIQHLNMHDPNSHEKDVSVSPKSLTLRKQNKQTNENLDILSHFFWSLCLTEAA